MGKLIFNSCVRLKVLFAAGCCNGFTNLPKTSEFTGTSR
jgi:hypothetical protein